MTLPTNATDFKTQIRRTLHHSSRSGRNHFSEYRVDPNTIAAGLLHDILEDTDTEYSEIKETLWRRVAEIVEGLTKLHHLQYEGSVRLNKPKPPKMVLAMARDIQVIFVKLADRLNNLRTLNHLDPERQADQQRNARCLAPIAHRLGMYRLKAELEDLAFKYLYPTEYKEMP